MDDNKRLIQELSTLNTSLRTVLTSIDSFSKRLDEDHAAQINFMNKELHELFLNYKKIERELKGEPIAASEEEKEDI